MSVRSGTNFQLEDTVNVFGNYSSEVIIRASYRVGRFLFKDTLGSVHDVFLSRDTESYVEAVSEMARRGVEFTKHVESDKYEKGPAWNWPGWRDVAAEEGGGIGGIQSVSGIALRNIAANAVLRAHMGSGRCPSADDAAALILAFRCYKSHELIIDARAMAFMSLIEPSAFARAIATMQDVSSIAICASVAHSFANVDSGPSITVDVSSLPVSEPTLITIQARIDMLSIALDCFEAPAEAKLKSSRRDEGVDSMIESPIGYRVINESRRVKAVLNQAAVALVMAGRYQDAEVLTEVTEDDDLDTALQIMQEKAKAGDRIGDFFTYLYTMYVDKAIGEEAEDMPEQAFKNLLGNFAIDIRASERLCVRRISKGVLLVCHGTGGFLLTSGKVVLITRTTAKLAIATLKEQLGMYVGTYCESGPKLAEAIHSATVCYSEHVLAMSDEDACWAGVAQRDFELTMKNLAAGDFATCSKSLAEHVSEMSVEHGTRSTALVAALAHLIEVDFSSVRSLRSIPPVYLSSVDFINESFRCYHLGALADQEAVSEFVVELKRLIANSHRKRTGEWPRGVQLILEDSLPYVLEAASSSGSIPFDVAAKWEVNSEGEVLWDPTAVRVRDKTNVPLRAARFETSADVTGMQPEETREVLYFADQDPVEVAGIYANGILRGGMPLNPVIIVPKGEQKKYDRVVAMEYAERRKANSLINNNAVPISDTLAGSLLGASGKKLADCESANSKALGSNCAGILQVFCAFIGVDFVKFGHLIAFALQVATFDTLAKYFGQPWITPHIEALKDQIVIVEAAGFFVKFRNVEGADGQGLRNGPWQVMLGAMASIIFREMRAHDQSIVDDERIFLTYFMDDHNFLMKLKLSAELSSKRLSHITAIICDRMAKLGYVMERKYNTMGVSIQAAKNVISGCGFVQCGDVYNKHGKVRVAGKGFASLVGQPSSRAPSLSDNVDSSVSACTALLANRASLRVSYVLMLWSTSYQLIQYRAGASSDVSIGAAMLLVTPRPFNGLGIPTAAGMVIARGVYNWDDALGSLYRHVLFGTPLAERAARILAQEAGEFSISSWCNSPVYVPRVSTIRTESAIMGMLKKTSFVRDKLRVTELLQDRERLMTAWFGATSSTATTHPPALWGSHPVAAVLVGVAMMTETSTAQVLLDPGSIKLARKINRVAAIEMVHWHCGGMSVDPSVVMKWAPSPGHMYANFSWSTNGMTLFGAKRGMTLLAVEPAPEGLSSKDNAIAVVGRNINLGANLVFSGTGPASTVDTSCKWVEPVVSSIITAVDVCAAVSRTGGGASTEALVNGFYPNLPIRQLQTVAIEKDPHVALAAVRYAPPVHVEALAAYTNFHSIAFNEYDRSVARKDGVRRFHTNYPLVQAAVAVRELLGCFSTGKFFVTGLAEWANPVCKDSGSAIPQNATKAMDPKTVKKVVQLMASSHSSKMGMKPISFKPKEVTSALLASARLAANMFQRDMVATDQIDTSFFTGTDELRKAMEAGLPKEKGPNWGYIAAKNVFSLWRG